MLGCKHHEFESGVLERLDPLVGVEIGGIEHVGIFGAFAPFGECVYAEMKECRHFKILPCKLLGCGNEIRSHFHALFHCGVFGKSDFFYIFLFLIRTS